MKLYDKLKCQLHIPDYNEDSEDQTFINQVLPSLVADKSSVRTLRHFAQSNDFQSKRDRHKELIRKKHNENQAILAAIKYL
jgi:hypothetical protein